MAEHGRAFRLDGTAFVLLGERALHWPATRTLLVADLHLGKGDAFRRAGLPVPRGGTRGDLARLAGLLASTRAARLVVLGDVLHGALHEDAGWRADWAAFRAAHTALAVEAVVGNHDRALPAGAEALGFHLLDEGRIEDGIALCHEPERAPAGRPSLCGHHHPAARVPGLGRLPAFWWRRPEAQLVLPAFSTFTGRIVPRLRRGDALYACAGHTVLPPLCGSTAGKI